MLCVVDRGHKRAVQDEAEAGQSGGIFRGLPGHEQANHLHAGQLVPSLPSAVLLPHYSHTGCLQVTDTQQSAFVLSGYSFSSVDQLLCCLVTNNR